MPQKRIIPRTCEQCGKDFLAPKQSVKQGAGRFCCHACYARSLVGKPSPKDRRISCVCATCGETFLRKQDEVAKFRSHYCSSQCYAARGPKVLRVCVICGKEFWIYPSFGKGNHGRHCSMACLAEGRTGEKSSVWKGKDSKQRGTREERKAFDAWRKAVKQRDGHTCQRCGTAEGTMHAHHVNPWKDFPALRFDLSNGITLCYACHRRVHSKHA